MKTPAEDHTWEIVMLMDEQRIIHCTNCGCEALIEAANSRVQCYCDKDGRWMMPDEPAPVCAVIRGNPAVVGGASAVNFTPEERLTAQLDLQKKFDAGNAEILALGGIPVKTVVGPVAPDGSCECTNTIKLPPIKMLNVDIAEVTCIRCGYKFLAPPLGAICPSCNGGVPK